MPTVSVRPPAINLEYYPGNPISVTFTYPAGYLDDNILQAYLNGRGADGTDATITVDDDVLTVEFDGDQTNLFDTPIAFELDLYVEGVEPLPDTFTPQIIGTWTPGTESAQPVAEEFIVRLAPDLSVTVSTSNLPGPAGATGATGAAGTNGTNGQGLATGGATNDLLTKVSGTDYDTTWVSRSVVALQTVYYSNPTNATTRSSTTLGSLGTAWTDSVTVATGQEVRYTVQTNFSVAGNTSAYIALAVDGTIVDRDRRLTEASGNQISIVLNGVVSGLSAASHTFEVYFASNGGEALTVSSVVDTSTSTGVTRDGLSAMMLTIVEAT